MIPCRRPAENQAIAGLNDNTAPEAARNLVQSFDGRSPESLDVLASLAEAHNGAHRCMLDPLAPSGGGQPMTWVIVVRQCRHPLPPIGSWSANEVGFGIAVRHTLLGRICSGPIGVCVCAHKCYFVSVCVYVFMYMCVCVCNHAERSGAHRLPRHSSAGPSQGNCAHPCSPSPVSLVAASKSTSCACSSVVRPDCCYESAGAPLSESARSSTVLGVRCYAVRKNSLVQASGGRHMSC